MPRNVTLATGMVAAILAVLVPQAASAAPRYASPAGTGASPCAAADPCSLPTAVGGAANGDEIIVAPGDYALTATLDTAVPLTIHGVAGQPRPKLTFSGAQNGLRLDSSGSLAQYLEVVQAEPGTRVLYLSGATGDQLILNSDGDANVQSGSTLQNSIVVTSGDSAITTTTNGATNNSTYRNVTAISTDPLGFGIRVSAAGATGHGTGNMFNVIAKGGGGGASIRATTDSSGATATINATNSNFTSSSTMGTGTTVPTPGTGTNQSSAPLYVNAAGGDYHQAPGSPTIGAGSAAEIAGALDVDGDPRSVGVPDIGGDEFVEAPAATTNPATSVVAQSATLNGTVDPKGAPTTYYFEYGPTDAYGSSTAVSDAGSGTGAAAATAAVSGLTPGTTYHFRIRAANSGGSVLGADQTFTTEALPPTQSETPPPTPSTNPGTVAPFTGMALVTRKLKFKRGVVVVTLRCPATVAAGPCTGRVALTARSAGKAAATVTIGRATFKAAAGSRVSVRVRINKAGRALLRRSKTLKAKLKVAARDGRGQSKTTTHAVTIKR
jgi:hypothetical protein